MKRLTAVLMLVGVLACGGDDYDVILANGWIVDGTGNPRYRGDLAIDDGAIAAVGRLPHRRAERTIDVSGLVVAPGFIDMLGWSDINVLADGRAVSKITQGITTEITGEGGSVAPQTPATIAEDAAENAAIGVVVDWRDLNGYFQRLDAAGSAINIATFVGATQVRKAVIGNENRAPTPVELERMIALVDTAMLQGALGLSTSLVYAPAFYATTGELITLAQAARRHGGVYATHLRDEGLKIDEAIEEALEIALAAQIPVEIWHLKRAGFESHGDMARVLAKLDSARGAGIDVAANVYPYRASATSLDASIPQWAHEGGDQSLVTRLKDATERARIRREILDPPGDIESFYRGAGGAAGVLVSNTLQDSLDYLEGKTIAEIAGLWGIDPLDAVFDIIIKDGGATGAIYFSMSEDDVQTAVTHWWVSFCTDYGARAPDGPLSQGKPHPRVYGSFTRILGQYVRQDGVLPLETAIRKMTSLPASRIGLTDRGLLRPGFAADVTVFDPRVVMDRATFEAPHQISQGIRYVLVNGETVLDGGQITDARPGRGLRGPGWRSDG